MKSLIKATRTTIFRLTSMVFTVALLAVMLLTGSLFMGGCGGRGVGGGEEQPDSSVGGWYNIIDEQKTRTGEYFPVTTMDIFFKPGAPKLFSGIIGCGSFYTKVALTIKLLIKERDLVHLGDIWVGGQSGRFNNYGSLTNIHWDRDLHRALDSKKNIDKEAPGVRVMQSKMYKWVKKDPSQGVNYFFTTDDGKTFYSYHKHRSILKNRKMHKYGTDTLSRSFVDFISVAFPKKQSDIDSLRALLFFEDGYIGYISGKDISGIRAPSDVGKPTDVAVQWDDKGFPEFVVASDGGNISGGEVGNIYYARHNGSEWDWTKIKSFPVGGEYGSPGKIKIYWHRDVSSAPSPRDYEIVATNSKPSSYESQKNNVSPAVWHKTDFTNDENWKILRQESRNFSDVYTYLDVSFGYAGHTKPRIMYRMWATLPPSIIKNHISVFAYYDGRTWTDIDTEHELAYESISEFSVNWGPHHYPLLPSYVIYDAPYTKRSNQPTRILYYDGDSIQTLHEDKFDPLNKRIPSALKCAWDETSHHGELLNVVVGMKDGSVRNRTFK